MVSAVLGFPPDYVTVVQDRHAAGESGHTGGYKMVNGPGVMDQLTASHAGYAAHIKYAPNAEERTSAGARDDFEWAERSMLLLRGHPIPDVLEYYRKEAPRPVGSCSRGCSSTH